MHDVYSRIGVPRVINADTTLTRLGGSLAIPAVMEAMNAAAESFVDVERLDRAVGERIAEMTRNEAALVTSGAAAALVLATLAAVTGDSQERMQRVLDHGPASLERRRIVVQRCQTNPYIPALTLGGAEIAWIGDDEGAREADLDRALTSSTVAIVFFAGAHLAAGSLDLALIADRAREHGITLVVDAAAQIPPTENLWRLTEAGATVAIFSGGKGLRGPGSTGLAVGQHAFIQAMRAHASPNQRSGRSLKVAKEEYVGLLAAVEHRMAVDEHAERRRVEEITEAWRQRLEAVRTLASWRDFPGEAGRPLPRLVVDVVRTGMTAAAFIRRLLEGEPGIAVAIRDETSILINAELLEPGEEVIVSDRICAVAVADAEQHEGE